MKGMNISNVDEYLRIKKQACSDATFVICHALDEKTGIPVVIRHLSVRRTIERTACILVKT